MNVLYYGSRLTLKLWKSVYLGKFCQRPWINYAVIKLIRERTAAFRRAKKSGKASDEAKYRKLRNKVVYK